MAVAPSPPVSKPVRPVVSRPAVEMLPPVMVDVVPGVPVRVDIAPVPVVVPVTAPVPEVVPAPPVPVMPLAVDDAPLPTAASIRASLMILLGSTVPVSAS